MNEPSELEEVATQIQRVETYADQHAEISAAGRYHLAHARKEWGHASHVQDKPGLQRYYLNIVRRDLSLFWLDL